jgi:hypothetical protein
MEWKNEELYIITLRWKTTFKKLYLGGEKGEHGKEKIGKALKDIEAIGDSTQNWEEFHSKSLDIFRKYGFERVDV